MSYWRLVRLNFGRNPAHFGELGIGMEETNERVLSDTLFSAWISAYARLFAKQAVEDLLKQFIDRPQQPLFCISSTFIYRRKAEQYIYYLPRLLELPRKYPCGENDLEFAKTFKKLSYLPLEIWQRWYQGDGFEVGDRQDLIDETKGKSNGALRQAGVFDYGKACETEQIPKIAVDRNTRATNLYHTGFVQFQWEQTPEGIRSLSGLYFLLHFSEANPTLENDLHAALCLLGEEGIGGERSSGAGRFEVEWFDFSSRDKVDPRWNQIVNFSQPDRYSLISLFWDFPPPENLLTKAASYTIHERGGWIASPFSGRQLRRKSVRMFAEGSIFPEAPIGKLADVTPDGFSTHRVYRSGISLSLPVHLAS